MKVFNLKTFNCLRERKKEEEEEEEEGEEGKEKEDKAEWIPTPPLIMIQSLS